MFWSNLSIFSITAGNVTKLQVVTSQKTIHRLTTHRCENLKSLKYKDDVTTDVYTYHLCMKWTGHSRSNALDLYSKMTGSNLTQDISYPDWGSSWFFFVPPDECQIVCQSGYDCFISNPSQFIVHQSPTIWHYAVYILTASLNNPQNKSWQIITV
jgi:hypothetical protein